jgi:hypothetical protein
VRSPFDDAIAAQQDEAVVEEQDPARAAERRPPGGKPLLRLMALLQRDGFAEPAATAVALAVPEDARAAFDEHLAQLGAAPDARPRRRAARRGRGRAAAKKDAAPSTEEIAEAYRETGERLGPPTPTGPQWRSLGPWTIPNGQTYGASRVNVLGSRGGDRDPSGEPRAGPLRSRQRRRLGELRPRRELDPAHRLQATLTVGAIAYDARNPSVVYCGTGEGNWWAFLGAGILRSADGGSSWSTLRDRPLRRAGFLRPQGRRRQQQPPRRRDDRRPLRLHERSAGWTQRRGSTTWSVSMARTGTAKTLEILAGCSDGVFRSTNGGTSWSSVTLPGSPGAFDRLAVGHRALQPEGRLRLGRERSHRLPLAAQHGGHVDERAGPARGQHRTGVVRLVPRRLARSRQPDLPRSDRVLPRRPQRSTWTWLNLSNKGFDGRLDPSRPARDRLRAGASGHDLHRLRRRALPLARSRRHLRERQQRLVISEFEFLAQHPDRRATSSGGPRTTARSATSDRRPGSTPRTATAGTARSTAPTPTPSSTPIYGMSPERSTTAGAFGSWTYLPPPVPAGEGSLFYPPFEASAAGGDTVAIGGDALYVSRNNATAWTRLAYPGGAASRARWPSRAEHRPRRPPGRPGAPHDLDRQRVDGDRRARDAEPRVTVSDLQSIPTRVARLGDELGLRRRARVPL